MDRGISSWLWIARCICLGFHVVGIVKTTKHVTPTFMTDVIKTLDKERHKNDYFFTQDGSNNVLTTYVDKYVLFTKSTARRRRLHTTENRTPIRTFKLDLTRE